MGDQRNLIVYNTVKQIIQNSKTIRTSPTSQETAFCDPKSSERLQVFRGNLKHVVVYMAGGGTYYEYECMHRLEQELGVQIIYGGDTMWSPERFLKEMNREFTK